MLIKSKLPLGMRKIVWLFPIIGIFFGLLLTEMLLQLSGYPYMGCMRVEDISEYRIGRFDPTLGWTYSAPHSTTLDEHVTYAFNKEGYRTQDIYRVTDFSKPRILIVGDSFLFGDGLNFEDTFGAHLERLLGHKYEVLNFAVQGYGLDQAYLRLRQLMPIYKPEFVIVDIHEDQDYRNANRDRRALFSCSRFSGTKPVFSIRNNQLTQIYAPERFETYDVPKLRLVWRRFEDAMRQKYTNKIALSESLYGAMKRFATEQNATLIEINYLLPLRQYQTELVSSPSAIVADYGSMYLQEDGVHPNALATERMALEIFQKFFSHK